MRLVAVLGAWLLATFAAPCLAQSLPTAGLMINRNSGMCIDVPRFSRAAGTPLIQCTCHDGGNQNWDFRAVSGGTAIVNRFNGMCLDVAGGAKDDEAAIVQSVCAGTASQRWSAQASGSWVQLVAGHSGKCLDVFRGWMSDEARLIQWTCHGGANQQWTLSPPGPPSGWSAKIALSIVPVAASTLRNGKILAWSAYDRFAYGGDRGMTYSTLFDPATNTATERLVSSTGHDMFCPGTATLPDGRILVNGGSSSAKTSIYDPALDTWTTGAPMNVPRGYQADTVLTTGEVLTVGGSWSGAIGNKIGEVWSKTGGWRRLPGIVAERMAGNDPGGMFRADNQMWLFAAPGGGAFHAGPSAGMNWLTTAGNGTITPAGNRGDDPYSMNGNVVMFEPGKLLKLGGAPAYEKTRASESAYVIDFSRGPSVAVGVVKQRPMAFPRAFASAVVLPTGQVVVVGGQSYPVPFSDDGAMLMPEIWTPATGTFARLPPMTTPRTYHSVATLMLDGRIWVGGGGLCGPCLTNHPDVEILSPPYLFNADGTPAARPVIRSAPASGTLGQTVAVQTDRAVAAFALVRLSAVTHTINNDQRRVPLPILSASGTTYQLGLPADRAVLLQGDWMLFAMTATGTPSLAAVLRIQ